MKRTIIHSTSLIAAVLLVVAVLITLSGRIGSASPNSSISDVSIDPGGGNISQDTISLLSDAESHPWTRERMLNAQPYPLENYFDQPNTTLQLDGPIGEPGYIPGSPPTVDQQKLTTQDTLKINSQANVTGYNYPAPFARYQNFDSYVVYPYSTVGVLFFKQYGVDYRCSAVSIGNSAFWTAGHCIHKGDNLETGWSTNIVFAPAYKNGLTPLGVWTSSHITTKGLWYEFGDLRYDMAGGILNEWNNQTVSDYAGKLGFAYNLDNDLHWLNIAYPSSAPFNGQTQQVCAGSFAYADMSFPNPSPVAMGCDMTRGSSGGPWIISFSGQSGRTNFLNGNNSYRYSIHPKELFSPYFGDAAKSLYDELQAGLSTNSDN